MQFLKFCKVTWNPCVFVKWVDCIQVQDRQRIGFLNALSRKRKVSSGVSPSFVNGLYWPVKVCVCEIFYICTAHTYVTKLTYFCLFVLQVHVFGVLLSIACPGSGQNDWWLQTGQTAYLSGQPVLWLWTLQKHTRHLGGTWNQAVWGQGVYAQKKE